MEKYNRAERRRCLAKVKSTRFKDRKVYLRHLVHHPKLLQVALGKIANTSKECACWMCSNPRRVLGKSFKELKYEQDLD